MDYELIVIGVASVTPMAFFIKNTVRDYKVIKKESNDLVEWLDDNFLVEVDYLVNTYGETLFKDCSLSTIETFVKKRNRLMVEFLMNPKKDTECPICGMNFYKQSATSLFIDGTYNYVKEFKFPSCKCTNDNDNVKFLRLFSPEYREEVLKNEEQ